MRPINIKISAFGPYKDEVYIDFSKFGDSGIFLVTGDTGSGKTTIFDAICFALFGVASGSNREKNSFRSDFASDDVKTYVKLKFLHKGIVYEIERSPSYMRKKKRGLGFTLVSGDATMIFNNEVITGDKNVTDTCVDILGINALQFRQVSMIAQGEFLKLLLAKSSDRAVIFRKIFDTNLYKDISLKLKKRYLDVMRKYEDKLLELENLKSNIIGDNLNVDDNISHFLEVVDDFLRQDKTEEDKLNVNKTNLLNKIQKVVSDIDNDVIVNNNFNKYDELKRQKNEKLELQMDIDLKRELVKKNRNIYDCIIPLYDKKSKLELDICAKEKELEMNKDKYDDVVKKYNISLEEYKKLASKIKKLDGLKVKLKKFEDMLPLFDEIDDLFLKLDEVYNIYNLLKIAECKEILQNFLENKKLNKQYLEEKNKFSELKDMHNELRNKYNLLYDKFISCQAGLIAEGLLDNCPCPVCGSLEHPNVASISVEVVTKDELDLSMADLEKCQSQLEKVSNNISSIAKELELSQKQIKNFDEEDIKKKLDDYLNKGVCDKDVSSYKIEDINNKITYLKASIDSRQALVVKGMNKTLVVEKIKDINNEIKKLELYINNVTEEKDKFANEKLKIQTVIKILDEDIRKLKDDFRKLNEIYIDKYKEFGYNDEEEYMKVKLDEDDFWKYESLIKEYDDEIIKLDTSLHVLKDLLKGKKRVNVEEFLKEKSLLEEKMSSVEEMLKVIHSRIENNSLTYDKLRKNYDKLKDIECMVSVYEDLSNTANGNIVGKNKVEFEQYVQTYYFDNVLVSANKRFSYMTDSRFLLVRKVSSNKLSDKLGLELEVIDNYTGKRRDVSSLSGGESFKASLALALGMSDVIQNYSGGIVIETMFIDEGFGSLDSDSLEQAMNAIVMLGNGNNLIGIISHVNELKDMIDKKIVVNKTTDGSNVEVIV